MKSSSVLTRERWVLGVDLGATKVCAALARVSPDESSEILGLGLVPLQADMASVDVDQELVVDAFRRAVEQAQRHVGIRCRVVRVGTSGPWIRLLQSRGRVRIADDAREIVRRDVERAVAAATTIHLPLDRDVMHTWPRRFSVDSHEDVRTPIGLYGRRLAVDVVLVSAPVTTLSNLHKVAHVAGYECERLVWSRVASAQTVTTDAQRQSGVIVMEFGAEMTSVLLYRFGRVVGGYTFEHGALQLRRLVAKSLELPEDAAEQMLRRWGLQAPSRELITVPVPEAGDELALRNTLADTLDRVLGRWLDEIRAALQREFPEFRSEFPHGIIVSGGVSSIDGFAERVANRLAVETRCGLVTMTAGHILSADESGRVAAAVGLARRGPRRFDHLGLYETISQGNMLRRLMDRISRVYTEYF